MTFQDFLKTASLNNETALSEAHSYTETTGRLISPDMMLSFITKFKLVDALIENPTTNEGKALKAAFNFGSEFNLIDGHPANIGDLLDQLILDGQAPEALKTALVAYANPVSYPFEDKNLADVMLARNDVPFKPVVMSGYHVVINVLGDCPNHNPRLLVWNPRTEKRQRVSSFYGVSSAGKYECLVPREWRGAELFVDDFFGLIE